MSESKAPSPPNTLTKVPISSKPVLVYTDPDGMFQYVHPVLCKSLSEYKVGYDCVPFSERYSLQYAASLDPSRYSSILFAGDFANDYISKGPEDFMTDKPL